jgi:hypothetical protein
MKNPKLGSTLGLQSLTRLITQRMLFAVLAIAPAPGMALWAQTSTLGTAFPMYVTTGANLVKIDSSGNQTFLGTVAFNNEPQFDASGLVLDSSGKLYVATGGLGIPQSPDAIVKVDLFSGIQTAFSSGGNLDGPHWLGLRQQRQPICSAL